MGELDKTLLIFFEIPGIFFAGSSLARVVLPLEQDAPSNPHDADPFTKSKFLTFINVITLDDLLLDVGLG